MAKLWQFMQGHPEPAFSEKLQKGDQGKFFKNRLKRCPCWKGPKALWRKCHYPLICMHLKSKTWKRFRRKQRLQRCPNGRVMAILQGHPKPAFSVKVQKGDQWKCFKNRPKSSPRLKGPKAHWRKWHYPLICTHLKCEHWKTFWRKQRLEKCQNGQVLAIFARSFKTRIFWKKGTAGPRKIFQKSSKKYISFERSKSTLAQMALSSY